MATQLNIIQQNAIKSIDREIADLLAQKESISNEAQNQSHIESFQFKRPQMECSISEAASILKIPQNDFFNEIRYRIDLFDVERNINVCFFKPQDGRFFLRDVIEKCPINNYGNGNSIYLTALHLVSLNLSPLKLDKNCGDIIICMGFYLNKKDEIKSVFLHKEKDSYFLKADYTLLSIFETSLFVLF